MYYQKYSVKITGETPLLMHQDNIQWADFIREWQSDPANKKRTIAGDDRSPAWTWLGYLYVEQGKVVIPSDNLMTVIREGATKVPIRGTRGTFKQMSQSGIVVDQASWPILVDGSCIEYARLKALIGNEDFSQHEELAKNLGFSLFVKRAKIGSSKHVRVRPRFDRWCASGTITVLDGSITPQIITNILKFGGAYAGLCDWRPSAKTSPGSFGKFSVEISEAST